MLSLQGRLTSIPGDGAARREIGAHPDPRRLQKAAWPLGGAVVACVVGYKRPPRRGDIRYV
jgi:hypothetical protein